MLEPVSLQPRMTYAPPPRVHLRSQPTSSDLALATAASLRAPDVVDRADSGRTPEGQRTATIP